ncbi:MAG: leucyl aminopeptidase [Planctomycetota bacterium]|nr:MAG: leucyl aminopeptidase [Planctomycetota bacterium]
MEIQLIESAADKTEADAIVIGLYQDAAPSGAAAAIDNAAGGLLAKLIERKEISAKRNDVQTLFAVPNVAAGVVAVVGLGPKEKFDRRAAFEACGAAAKKLAGKARKRVAYFVADGWTSEQTEAGICGVHVGDEGQDLFRAEKRIFPPGEVCWAGTDRVAAWQGQVIGEATNLTRRLVNEPPQDIYPESFANRAADVAYECGLQGEIWDLDRLEAERCGALLAVARGSSRPPRMVILRHDGGSRGAPTLALVGKGVTFDSGGLSLKPTDGMLTMKCDMAGAATVVGVMQAIARLGLPVNVIALCGLVENMVSGRSYKLGDVLTARNGKTIEVHNTDAEGRLVLADVLSVAVDRGAASIVDLATLTGACVVALGLDVAGLMTNDEAWAGRVRAAADVCGEMVWPLPMFEHFNEQIKSEVADIKNVGEGRWGGAITAAKFLEEFVGTTPWAHIDIAGPAFREKPKPFADAGASGQFVRTLVEVARGWK